MTNSTNAPIVIIDDEQHTVLGLTITLKKNLGIREIKGFSTADDALAFMKTTPPRLVLMDIGMPGTPGNLALPTIKSWYPKTPVIMITADIEEEKEEQCLSDGAFYYLTKPVQNQRLLEVITRALHEETLV